MQHKTGLPSAAKYSLLFLVGFVVCPILFILLHEAGHYAAQTWLLGGHSTIHYNITITMLATVPEKNRTPAMDALQRGAAPLVDAVIAVAGFLWLYKLRKHRREAAPTVLDWSATILAFKAMCWLPGFAWTPSDPKPKDEVLLSQFLGLPGWGLPYLLALLCLIPLVATIRLHPPGARLFPFASYVLGVAAGGLVWFTFLGPALLP